MFKVGDRVVFNPKSEWPGELATVRYAEPGRSLAVEFDRDIGHGHCCSYEGKTYVPSGRGWWVGADRLTLMNLSPFEQSVHDYITSELQ